MSSTSTLASDKKMLDTENDIKCPVCQQKSANHFNLQIHLCRHFLGQLADSFGYMMNNTTCTICEKTFKEQSSVIIHIGIKHGKINKRREDVGLCHSKELSHGHQQPCKENEGQIQRCVCGEVSPLPGVHGGDEEDCQSVLFSNYSAAWQLSKLCGHRIWVGDED